MNVLYRSFVGSIDVPFMAWARIECICILNMMTPFEYSLRECYSLFHWRLLGSLYLLHTWCYVMTKLRACSSVYNRHSFKIKQPRLGGCHSQLVYAFKLSLHGFRSEVEEISGSMQARENGVLKTRHWWRLLIHTHAFLKMQITNCVYNPSWAWCFVLSIQSLSNQIAPMIEASKWHDNYTNRKLTEA